MFNTPTELKKAASAMKTLGNQYRLQIVTLLLNGEKCVNDLNQSVRVSQPALSQHLSKLRRAGILGARRDARNIYYFIANPRVITMLGGTRDMITAVK